MASHARKRTEAQLSKKREAEEAAATARLLGAAAQLKERAETEGVLAFLRKPVERLRPNERYLQNTLNSVNYANRRADEAEMWERLEMARARERRERRQRIEEQQRRRGYGAVEDAGRSDSDPSDSGSRRDKGTEGFEEVEAPGDTVQGGEDECQIEEFLSRKRARGRGAVGSRVEEAGPYLPVGGKDAGGCEAEAAAKGRPRGPDAPSWVRAGGTSVPSSSSPSSDDSQGVESPKGRRKKKSSDGRDKKRKRGSSVRKHKSKKEKRKRKKGERL